MGQSSAKGSAKSTSGGIGSRVSSPRESPRDLPLVKSVESGFKTLSPRDQLKLKKKSQSTSSLMEGDVVRKKSGPDSSTDQELLWASSRLTVAKVEVRLKIMGEQERSKIESIMLWENLLDKWPEPLCTFQSLLILDLEKNMLTVIPAEIAELKSLKVLKLGGNQIESMDALVKVVSLEELKLSNNLISEIPAGICEMTELRSLMLSHNRISNLPDELFQLVQLEHLNLANNKLKRIPSLVGNLRMLNSLYLNSNPLLVLPVEMKELKSLTLIALSNTKLPLSIRINCLNDNIACKRLTADVEKVFGPDRAARAAVITLLAIRKYRKDKAGIWVKLPTRAMRKICFFLLESKHDPEWSVATTILEERLRKRVKESKASKSELESEEIYDKESYRCYVSDAKRFYDSKDYILALQCYKQAAAVRPTEKIQKKIDYLNSLLGTVHQSPGVKPLRSMSLNVTPKSGRSSRAASIVTPETAEEGSSCDNNSQDDLFSSLVREAEEFGKVRNFEESKRAYEKAYKIKEDEEIRQKISKLAIIIDNTRDLF